MTFDDPPGSESTDDRIDCGATATAGVSRAAIEGADFAEALLLISIGSEPPNEELKSRLLGGACE